MCTCVPPFIPALQFPITQRPAMSAFVQIATGAGVAAGQVRRPHTALAAPASEQRARFDPTVSSPRPRTVCQRTTSQGLSSLAGQGDWRLPFLIVAIPMLIMSFVVLLTTPEPPRGASVCLQLLSVAEVHPCDHAGAIIIPQMHLAHTRPHLCVPRGGWASMVPRCFTSCTRCLTNCRRV